MSGTPLDPSRPRDPNDGSQHAGPPGWQQGVWILPFLASDFDSLVTIEPEYSSADWNDLAIEPTFSFPPEACGKLPVVPKLVVQGVSSSGIYPDSGSGVSGPPAPQLLLDPNNPVAVIPQLENVRTEGILKYFSAYVLNELWARGSVVTVHDGVEVKIRKDERFILLEGRITAYLDDAASSHYTLTSAEPGVVLGELSSYARNDARDERIVLVAEGEVKGLLVPRGFFESAVRGSIGALEFMLQLQSERLKNMNSFAAEAVRIDINPEESVPRSRGEFLADSITKKLGTWKVVAGFVAFSCAWMAVNAVRSFLQWDEYPFVFLNLCFSVVSGLTMPVVLMSQNRQSAADRFASRVTQLKVLELSRKVAELLDRQTVTEGTTTEVLEHVRALRAQTLGDSRKDMASETGGQKHASD